MKKTTTKKAIAKKPVMRNGGVKKKLPKAQTGNGKTLTPFQNYMATTPEATASDTTQTFTGSRDWSNPKLDKAYFETFYAGQENKRRKGPDVVRYDAKGNRIKKTGGATKCASCGGKMKKGGTAKSSVMNKIKTGVSNLKKRK